MATQIKRVRFFDGQFLKEIDFRDEQAYHLHMRRRMSFFLFGQSGVIQLGPDDLKFFATDNANKTFRVRAGMAMCRSATDVEGKEIILLQDSPPIDLDTEGITAGGQAFVTIHFEQEEAKDPPSEGDEDQNTRYREKAVLDVHPAAPAGPAPNGEEYILLGTIAYDTMVASYSARMEAKLRSSLFQAAPAPSITGVSGTTTATAGGPSVSLTIQGSNLAGATAVTFIDPAVIATNIVASANSVTLTVTAGGGAAAGQKTFTVTTPAGVAHSPGGVFFTVAGGVSAPTITGINPNAGTQGSTVNAIITGTNLLNASAVGISGTEVSATPGSGTATSLPVVIGIGSTAATGPRTFTVTTPGGIASSGGIQFTVQAPVPVPILHSLQPNIQNVGLTIDIHGNNIRDPNILAGSPATGTLVQLRKGGTTKAVATGTVRPDAFGRQVVRITVPDRSGTPWLAGEVVSLELTFNGQTAAPLPFTFGN